MGQDDIKTNGTRRVVRGQPIEQRLHAEAVATPSGCVEFGGTKVGAGYGRLWWHGRNMLAHRVAWELAHGPISDGLEVLHSCDNPSCINIEHLSLGTHAENMRQMSDRGRRGGPAPRVIDGRTITEWATHLGVARSVVYHRVKMGNAPDDARGDPRVIDGRTTTEWATHLGVSRKTIASRIAHGHHPTHTVRRIDGETVAELSARTGIPARTIRDRLRRGIPPT